MFVYTEAEVVGRNISELMPSPYREQHNDYLAFYLKNGKSSLMGKSRNVFGQRIDGSTFPMSLGIGEFFDGNERFFTGIVQDISDRKTAEMALWTCESDGACDYLSRQWIRFTGIPAADKLGFNWLRQIHPTDKKGLLQQWMATV